MYPSHCGTINPSYVDLLSYDNHLYVSPKMMTSFMNSPLHKLHRILRCFLSKSCCHEKNSGTTGSNKDQLWWGGALDLSQFGCLSLAQCQLPGGCERWSALNDQLVITIGELVTEEQMNQGHQRPLMHCYHGPFPQVYCSSCGIPSIPSLVANFCCECSEYFF